MAVEMAFDAAGVRKSRKASAVSRNRRASKYRRAMARIEFADEIEEPVCSVSPMSAF